MGPLDALLDPLDQPEFTDGVAVGLWALLAVALVGAAFRGWARRPAPVAGFGVAGAAFVAMGETLDVPDELLLGAALCAAAGLLVDLFDLSPLIVAAAAVPGAWIVASAPGVADSDGWFPALALGVTVAAGGALVAAFDRRWRRQAWGPGLLAVTAGGIYSTVPDTELALAVFGAALVVALAGWPLRLAHLGGAGSMAAVAVIAWSVVVGGVGRDGSVIGGLACLGMLAVDPAIRLLGERSPLRHVTEWGRVALIGAAHVVLVLWMARVAGLRDDAGAALVLVVAGFAAAAVLWAIGGRWRRRPAR